MRIRSRSGIASLQADAALAVQTLGAASPWRPSAVVLLGLSELLTGAFDQADDLFADAAEQARHLGAPNMLPVALAERAIISIDREQWVQAGVFAEQAVAAARRSHLEDTPLNGLVYAVAARTALRAERTAAAQELLARAQGRVARLTYALPIPAVQTRLQLAQMHLAQADHEAARAMLDEIDAVLRRCPDLGTLPEQAAALRLKLSQR